VMSVDGMVEPLFGRTAEALMGQNALAFVHPDDFAACMTLGLEAIADIGVDHSMTHRICRPDGTVRLVRATMHVADAADGSWTLHFYDAHSALHQEMVHALDHDQFVVQYQPLINVDTGFMTGTEALVRWVHPTRGLVPPMDFIPEAESSGLIVELGAWVLRTACREAAGWPEHLHVAVNLSARQLDDEGIVATVADALLVSGLKPDRLVLEVTESALLGDPEKAIGFLTQLKSLGVGLAIDDFGTGYSSLLYLKRMPVDVLKVDQSFVSGLGEDAGDTAIVASVISLAHAFGLRVVAEGVETPEQHQHLAILNCDFAQGYLWNKAMPADQLRRAIAEERVDAVASRSPGDGPGWPE
jgi:EAL domain-containing protein (putative c-di-GMP-specific phosphodiesterase class I)